MRVMCVSDFTCLSGNRPHYFPGPLQCLDFRMFATVLITSGLVLCLPDFTPFMTH